MNKSLKSILSLFIIAATIFLAFKAYKKYAGKDHFDQTTNVVVYLFSADWCSHCTAFRPEWDKAVQQASDDGLPVTFVVYDADNEEDKPAFSEYNIEKFPTILIGKGGNTPTTYEGTRDAESLLVAIKKLI